MNNFISKGILSLFDFLRLEGDIENVFLNAYCMARLELKPDAIAISSIE